MNVQRPRLSSLLIGSIAAFASACGAAKTSSNPPPTGSGQLAIKMVDAPPDAAGQVDQIWVTINQVTAHSTADGWVPIQMKKSPLTLDLKKLQDNAVDLGFLNMPTGTTITQIRLYVDPGSDVDSEPHVILKDGTRIALKVPSGSQSGIKIHGPWQISECKATAVTLDFDGKKSIFTHPAKQGEEWILRPVIRVKMVETVATGCSGDAGSDNGPPTCDILAPSCVDDNTVCVSSGESAACLGHPGADCSPTSTTNECVTGVCDALTNMCGLGDLGGPCVSPIDCRSKSCDTVTKKCVAGAGGASCDLPGDCESIVCLGDHSCAGGMLPPTAPCLSDGECGSNYCDQGACADVASGDACTRETTCQGDMVCIPGEGSDPGYCGYP